MTAYLNTKAAAKYLGLGQSTLERWRCDGSGPAFTRLGPKLVRYSTEDLDEFAGRQKNKPGLGGITLKAAQ